MLYSCKNYNIKSSNQTFATSFHQQFVTSRGEMLPVSTRFSFIEQRGFSFANAKNRWLFPVTKIPWNISRILAINTELTETLNIQFSNFHVPPRLRLTHQASKFPLSLHSHVNMDFCRNFGNSVSGVTVGKSEGGSKRTRQKGLQ